MTSPVYVETTVPSAYVSTRTDPSSLHRRDVTRAWWRDQLSRYDVWISAAVVLELEHGDWPGKIEALHLVRPLRRVSVSEEVGSVARRYVKERLVPANLTGDALPLAAAGGYEFDFLLTPQVMTPETLWLEENERPSRMTIRRPRVPSSRRSVSAAGISSPLVMAISRSSRNSFAAVNPSIRNS